MGKQKKITALAAGINLATVLQEQKATAPQAMLHVKDSSVLFSGPAQGAGTRLMWYAPGMAALLSEGNKTKQIQMKALKAKINLFEKS